MFKIRRFCGTVGLKYQTIMLLTFTAMLVTAFWAMPAEAERKTIISGLIRFYDDDGRIVRPYPWETEVIEDGLKARAVNIFQESEIRKPLALSSRAHNDELHGMEVAEYEVDTSDTLALPTVVRVSFAADVWSGSIEFPLTQHLGRVDKEHLAVRRIFDTNVDQVNRIRQVLADRARPLEEYRDAYDWTIALTNTPDGDAGPNNAEDFMLLVDVIEAMIERPGAMDQRIAEDLAAMDLDRDFETLRGPERYRVLSEMAYVVARSPYLDQPIYTDYTFYDLARSLFNRAIDIAKAEKLLLSGRLEAIHQERYKMSCEYGLIDQQKFLDCISDIDAFMTSVSDLSLAARRAGLSDFERYLYLVSGARLGHGLTASTRQKIACDADLSFYWAMFGETVDLSGSVRLARATHLKSAYELAKSPETCKLEG